jgi:hypothetical protein
MIDLQGQLVFARCDGREYEGRHDGIEYEGPFPFHRLLEARCVNHQTCIEKRAYSTRGEHYEIPGVLRIPAGLCLIHPTHLSDRT